MDSLQALGFLILIFTLFRMVVKAADKSNADTRQKIAVNEALQDKDREKMHNLAAILFSIFNPKK